MYGGLALSQNTQTLSGRRSRSASINQPPKHGRPAATRRRSPRSATSRRPACRWRRSTFVGDGRPQRRRPARPGSSASRSRSTRPIRGSGSSATTRPSRPSQLDQLVTKRRSRSRSTTAPVPDGLDLGTTTVDPPTVTISGAASSSAQVVSVRADVMIQPTGIDVDQDVRLVADRQPRQCRPPARGHAADGPRRRSRSSPTRDTDAAGQPGHHRDAGRRVRDRLGRPSTRRSSSSPGDADQLAAARPGRHRCRSRDGRRPTTRRSTSRSPCRPASSRSATRRSASRSRSGR